MVERVEEWALRPGQKPRREAGRLCSGQVSQGTLARPVLLHRNWGSVWPDFSGEARNPFPVIKISQFLNGVMHLVTYLKTFSTKQNRLECPCQVC